MKKFYIGERNNPQLRKPYYKAYGQLTKKAAKEKEKCLYGGMSLTSYKTKIEHNKAISNLQKDGLMLIFKNIIK